MERKVTKLEHSHTEVVVTVDAQTWKAAQEKAFKKVASNLQVDGFRKGKVPENIARKHVDQGKVLDEAINSLLPTVYSDIIREEKLEPVARPQVDVTKISDTDLELKFVIVTAPEVKLGQYKGLAIGKQEVTVSDEEVEKSVKDLVASSASLVVKEGEAKEGDTVVMDFAGSIDGKPFDGGSANNHELELGSHQFIPGFEEQLVGHKAGEHVEVKVKFPENYVEELKGKDAVFACDIHEVKEKKMPELNEEFIKELGMPGVENLEQLKAAKKDELLKQKQQAAERDYMAKLYDAIAANATIDLPEEMVEDQVQSRRQEIEGNMKKSGFDLKTYLQMVGQTEEQFLEQIRKDARRDITNFFVSEEVGKAEKIEVSDADVEFEYSKLAEQYKMKLEDVKKALQPQENQFRHNIKAQRIDQFLLENNK